MKTRMEWAIVFALLIIEVTAYAQPPGLLWSRTFGGDLEERCQSVVECSDGGYVLAGLTRSYGAGGTDVWMVKIDANGDSLWSRTFGGQGDDECASVQRASDGGYVLGGSTFSFGVGNWDFWLIKTDADGNSLWSRTYGRIYTDICQSVQQTTDGGYILAGYSGPILGANDEFWMVKTDSDGDSLWSRTFGGPQNDYCYSVQQTSDGGYILAGELKSLESDNWESWMVKTDANGTQLWNRVYFGGEFNQWNSVQQTSDAGYLLGGEGAYNMMKTDANGDSLWSLAFGGQGYTAQEASDGGYALAGSRGTHVDFWLLKTTTDGGILWSRAFNQGHCRSFQQTTDGGYILVGYTPSLGPDNIDMLVVKTEPEGPVPFIVVDPPALDFGSVPPGDTLSLMLTIASTGTADLIVTDITASHGFGTDFSGPQTVPPGQEIAIQVSFSPDADQEYDGTLTILSNAPSSPTFIPLTGRAAQPGITIDPVSLNFGSVSVGNNSSLTLTIFSTGGIDLTILELTVSATFSTDFTGPQTVPPSAQIPVQVTFSPDSAQVYWDSLFIISDAPNSPTAVLLTGVGIASATGNPALTVPDEYCLYANYPNPFNSATTIRYDVKQPGSVKLTVFDLLGKEVAKLASGPHLAGSYTITWNAADLPSGTYLCRMAAQDFVQTRKVVLVK